MVLAFTLLVNETTETHESVLNTVLSSMGHTEPISVVTDDDLVMHQGIMNVLETCGMILYLWNIERNIYSQIHNHECFRESSDFTQIRMTHKEFEE